MSKGQTQQVCENLGLLVRATGVTQVQLAEYAGWKRSTLSRMLGGKHPPGVDGIFYILNVINAIKGTAYTLKDIDVTAGSETAPNDSLFLP